ncbi:type I-F CRISPR-associated protein Csy3 [Halomonas sp. QX-2]|uniref:Type I-F CRISPR-associated protein Csy3 n=1 Tax=Vreelandella sedimenti TaxID=2729618 RepID=A0A7Z0N7M3_9GAMM|nr:type I-F CRISPR-associated protein Csy3 [Halomonas sedimenti]NYT72972.1 type I-F CRISPR-associated protein Csy3 [Halomonas sedimenti]|tara:strand:+ start:6983 stop:8041 length:1059 start_codon:yes stop_codon:yes gene_type:complete
MNPFKHLSYERSLNPGKAVFYYRTATSEFEPLQAEVMRLRAPKATFTDGYMSTGAARPRETSGLGHANLITIETCYVPPLVDVIYCRFSLRVIANSLEPRVCDDSEINNLLKLFADEYLKAGGYKELAMRYAKNILSAEWLWRNKKAQGVSVEVITSNENKYNIRGAQHKEWGSLWKQEDDKTLDEFSEELTRALSIPEEYLFIDVNATINAGFCQEIYPSQVFTEKSKNGYEGSARIATKQYLKVTLPDGRQAVSFGSYKVGAAIQKIDDWWMDNDAEYPLRVSEYGADRQRVLAMREPTTGLDYYSLLSKVDVLTNEIIKTGCVSSHSHFFMSVLVKGGMFQKGIKKGDI